MRLFKVLVFAIISLFTLTVTNVQAILIIPEQLRGFEELRSTIGYCQECYEIITHSITDPTQRKQLSNEINVNKKKLDIIEKLLAEKQEILSAINKMKANKKKMPDEYKSKKEEREANNNKLEEEIKGISISPLVYFVESVKTAFFRIDILKLSDFTWQPEKSTFSFLFSTPPNKYLSKYGLTSGEELNLKKQVFDDLYNKFFKDPPEERRSWRSLWLKKETIPQTYSEKGISKSILDNLYKLVDDKGKARFQASNFFRKPADLNWWLRVALTERPFSRQIIHKFLTLKVGMDKTEKDKSKNWLIFYLSETPEFKKDEVARCLAGLLKHEIAKA